MKNKDALKKHHFWIMFGVVPLFVLIAVLVVSANVGDAIKKREDDIEAKKTAIKSKTNPKSNALLKKMDELIDQVKSKQDVLWGECYYPQKNIYSSEAMKSLVTEEARQDFEHKIIKPVEKLKFGAPINREDVNTQSELLRRSEFYADWYENLAKKIAPTTFAGSWKKQLRYVDSWTDVKLNSDQIWLMLEDMWVQKSLVEAIGSVNEQLADFQRIKFERNGQVIDDPDEKSANPKHPLRRKFKSRTWEVELEVIVEAGGKKYLKGRLINTTDKLQLLGVGNTMVLRVWLANGKDVSPFEFKINNEYVAGAGDSRGGAPLNPSNVYEIQRSGDHTIPATMAVEEIVRVEQAFDVRTVPIHVVQNFALGYPDARNKAFPLKALKEEPAAAAPDTSGAGGVPGGGPGSGSMKPGGGMMMPPAAGGGGGGGAFGQSKEATAVYSGGGPVASIIDGNKKRYLDANDQVRRMPVSVTVVVDQAYLQDVLLAFANSALRFQITQVTLNRFHGTLDLGGGSSGSSGESGSVIYGGQTQFGAGFGTSGGLKPGGPGPGSLSGGPPRTSGPGPGGPGMGPGSMGSFGMTGQPSTVAESQLTSGLVELTVYGVVSLYSSPEAAAADAAPKKEPSPKDKEQPKDKDKLPADKKDKAPADKKDKAPADKTDTKGKAPADKDSKDKTPAGKEPETKTPDSKK